MSPTLPRRFCRVVLLASVVAVAGVAASAFAATPTTNYWDGDGVGAQNGGSGTWGSSMINWATTSGGTTYFPWGGGNNAVFSGAAGTVSLGGLTDVNQLSFLTTGYTI